MGKRIFFCANPGRLVRNSFFSYLGVLHNMVLLSFCYFVSSQKRLFLVNPKRQSPSPFRLKKPSLPFLVHLHQAQFIAFTGVKTLECNGVSTSRQLLQIDAYTLPACMLTGVQCIVSLRIRRALHFCVCVQQVPGTMLWRFLFLCRFLLRFINGHSDTLLAL